MLKKLFILLVTLFFLMACNEEDELTPSLPPVNLSKRAEVIPVASFTVPETSVISLEKAKQFVDASFGLLLLGEKWSKEIESATDQEKVRVLQSYKDARDQVCAKVGLAGIVEFEWLSKVAIKNPENEIVLKEAGFRFH